MTAWNYEFSQCEDYKGLVDYIRMGKGLDGTGDQAARHLGRSVANEQPIVSLQLR